MWWSHFSTTRPESSSPPPPPSSSSYSWSSYPWARNNSSCNSSKKSDDFECRGGHGTSKRRNTSLGSLSHLKCIFMKYRKILISTLYLPEKHGTVLLFSSIIYLFMIASVPPVGANIDCFKCSSLNGDNQLCEDPFHNNYSLSILEAPCMGSRKGRDGLFPATACIKMAGVFVDTGETIMVRGCALDSGTLNTDTEIIRMSHCGHFYFEERYVKGCLKSCEDSDGCNATSRPFPSPTLIYFLLPPIQLLSLIHYLRIFHTNFL